MRLRCPAFESEQELADRCSVTYTLRHHRRSGCAMTEFDRLRVWSDSAPRRQLGMAARVVVARIPLPVGARTSRQCRSGWRAHAEALQESGRSVTSHGHCWTGARLPPAPDNVRMLTARLPM